MENLIIFLLFGAALWYLVRLFKAQFSSKKACSKGCGCASAVKQNSRF